MRILRHIIYWTLVLLFLTLFFGRSWGSYLLAFYFSSLLLPIVMGTSYFFNLYLVPNYLLKGKYWTLALYSFYMLVVSLYLEILVALISYVIIANYKIELMRGMSSSIYVLGITLYLIVFITSFIRLMIRFRSKAHQLEILEKEKQKNEQTTITIRVDRKNQQILLDELLYIESLDDQVKVVTDRSESITREKISQLHQNLPDRFIRVHRSFLINRDKISSFNHEQVMIGEAVIPIGRKYKKQVIEELKDIQMFRHSDSRTVR